MKRKSVFGIKTSEFKTCEILSWTAHNIRITNSVNSPAFQISFIKIKDLGTASTWFINFVIPVSIALIKMDRNIGAATKLRYLANSVQPSLLRNGKVGTKRHSIFIRIVRP